MDQRPRSSPGTARLASLLAALWLAGLAAVLSVLAAGPAHAQKRVALVIGNANYARAPRLANPENDATAVARMLTAAGFTTVRQATDLGGQALRRALRDFTDDVRDADIALVFYAGHGIEVSGTNYLVPVDAVLERDIDVEDEAVPLERVTQVLEQAKRLRIVILDACRDNPFVRDMRRTIATRSIGRGLARVDVVSTDTLIAYAARAGSTADDGNATNSPYTTALLKHLPTPGLDVRLALGLVRDEVLRTTQHRQEPFVYGSLGGSEIALVPKVAGEDEIELARKLADIAAREERLAALEKALRQPGGNVAAPSAQPRPAPGVPETTPAPPPPTRTEVRDARAEARLLGKRRLSSQNISWDYFGTLTATKTDGLIRLEGEQKSRDSSDFVRVDGVVASIDATSFELVGTVTQKAGSLNRGKLCVVTGRILFAITQNRKYWRMREPHMDACGSTSYVDIYF